MPFIVGIDGTAGSGKGTITGLLAKELNLVNIDTGATYRALTLAAIRKGLTLENKEEIIELSTKVHIDIDEEQRIFLDGEDVSKEIRSKEVTSMVSQLSSIKEVRINMVEVQRKLAEGKNVIMEGRDITTYVFPNANVKIYLDGKLEERAKRRFKENTEKGIDMSYEEVLENIRIRDENDKNKEIGSLILAPDATYIDTTNMTIEEVKNKIKEIIMSFGDGG